MKSKLLLLAAATIFTCATADARQRTLSLDYGDQQYQGNSVLHLKQDLRAAYPDIRINQSDLVRVQLVAKSRRGQGSAWLQVGNRQSQERRIGGSPLRWNDRRRASFDTVAFNNPGLNSDGVWQIHLQGNIKVRQVVVVIDDAFGPGGPGDDNRVTLDCSSWDYQPTYCRANGYIVAARLLRQHSVGRGQCIQGQTFGVYNGYLWVDYGCRGTFEVRLY